MAIEYKIRVFDALWIGTADFSTDHYKEQKRSMVDDLNKLGAEGWKIVGQSVLAEVENHRSVSDEINTNFRILFTFAREK